jgi:hypothetical protein
MTVRLRIVLAAALAALSAAAQQQRAFGYPDKDALSPFRNPTDAYAPPDEAFRLLRLMQAIADAPGAPKSFDADGREVVADARWREARADLMRVGLDAGYLAQIMRLNRNDADRATAFYAAFHVRNVDHVFELIAHIPGEPLRRTREAAFPRAVEFVRANLKRRFGDLTAEQQEMVRKALPKPGSPEANARGVVRAPLDTDTLHQLTLVPFLQLLDVDEPIDQAQALWFLKEVLALRDDLALLWLEPSLPRVKQLLAAKDERVRAEAIGLFQAIGPKDLPKPPDDATALQAWADAACKRLFPPVRNLNDAIVQLHPSPERDAIAKAGLAALERSSIGDPVSGQLEDGTRYRGFRVIHVPDELKPLAIPADAVVTTVNGVATPDAATLLQTVQTLLAGKQPVRRLMVEYLLKGEPRAIEYRVM